MTKPIINSGNSRNVCGRKTEVFSRVCGYHRPVKNWNKGKQEEMKERKLFVINDLPIKETKLLNPT